MSFRILRSFWTCLKSCLSILHLSPQIWSISEWQAQKAFLNLSSCSHSHQSISGLCLGYERQARGAWNQAVSASSSSLSPIPSKPLILSGWRSFWCLSRSPVPTLHRGRLSRGAPSTLPNIPCHFLSTKLSDDFPSRQHFGEFSCHFLRKGLLGRFFPCPYKV